MDCVILAGTVGREAGWTQEQPRSLLPLPSTTLIGTLVARLHEGSGGNCVICANGHTKLIARRMASHGSLTPNVGFFEDRLPRGTAGCLKACEPHLSGRTIFVVGGSVWLEDDPDWMLEQHRAQGNALTVFCTRDPDIAGARNEALLKPAGVYCCDPAVLDFIRSDGYQDLKEQLIPALRRAGLRVGAVTLRRATCEVSDWQTYVDVLRRVLSMGRFDTNGYRRLAPDVWCGEGVDIAPGARIIGPALLGHGCRIDDGAVLIGPAMLGNECHVSVGSWLVRVIAANRTRVPAGTSVADQFLPSEGKEASNHHQA
ncbi:MAG: NDP-sugar synthase [Phycisphaerae bacterium]